MGTGYYLILLPGWAPAQSVPMAAAQPFMGNPVMGTPAMANAQIGGFPGWQATPAINPQQTQQQGQMNPMMLFMNLMMMLFMLMLQGFMQQQQQQQASGSPGHSTPSPQTTAPGSGASGSGAVSEPGKAEKKKKKKSKESNPSGQQSCPPGQSQESAGISNSSGSADARERLAEVSQREANQRNTKGWCYAGVKDAVSETLGIPRLPGGSAYQAADAMRAHPDKFEEIGTITPEQLKDTPRGAVVVWERNKYSPEHGDIGVHQGDGKQTSDTTYSKAPVAPGTKGTVFVPKG